VQVFCCFLSTEFYLKNTQWVFWVLPGCLNPEIKLTRAHHYRSRIVHLDTEQQIVQYLVMSKLGEWRKHDSKRHVSLLQQVICTRYIIHS